MPIQYSYRQIDIPLVCIHRSTGLPNNSSLISSFFVALSDANVLSMARLLCTASFSAELRAQPMFQLSLSQSFLSYKLAQIESLGKSSFSVHRSSDHTGRIYSSVIQLLPKLPPTIAKISSTHAHCFL